MTKFFEISLEKLVLKWYYFGIDFTKNNVNNKLFFVF